MGIKSIDWFKSYLSRRSQIAHVHDTEPDHSPVTCGVPQGCIFCHLFLCYIVSNLELSIRSESKVLLYADDSVILYHTRILG